MAAYQLKKMPPMGGIEVDKIHNRSSAMSLVIPVTASQAILMDTVIVLLVISFPLKAHSIDCNVSGDIPFSVTNECKDCAQGCLICEGPWGRVSPFIETHDLELNKSCTFYAAADNIFSVWGRWTCIVIDPGPNFCSTVLTDEFTEIDFCLQKPTSGVTLKIKSDTPNLPDLLEVDQPRPPCASSVSSFLGDNSKQEKSRPDSDEFTFKGTDGDEVTLRLDTNPQEGNNGGEASLEISGNSLNESTTGTPPLELDTTLPGDGEYLITVEQPKNSAESFRGSYILSVTPSIGSIDLIEPTNSVEK